MPSYRHALVRGLPSSFGDALCAAPSPEPIDVDRARAQHAAYVQALRGCGLEVIVLDADDRFPDGCFVEDRAIVADGRALVTASAASSRSGEAEAVEEALRQHLEVVRMAAPATLDGGDCLRLGRTFYVGRSARTNEAGVASLREAFAPLGFEVREVEVERVLHLKCVCAPLGDGRMVLAEGTVPPSIFAGAEIVLVPPEEKYAANCLAVGDRVIVAAGFPETARRLASAGFEVVALDTSEIRKADGALTCMSILW